MEHDAQTLKDLAAYAEEAVFLRFDTRNGTAAEGCALLGVHRNQSWLLLYDAQGRQVLRQNRPDSSALLLDALAELAQGQTPRLTRFALSYAAPSSEDLQEIERCVRAFEQGKEGARQALLEQGLPALRALRGQRLTDAERQQASDALQRELEGLQAVVEQHGMHTSFRLFETWRASDPRAERRLQAIAPLEVDIEAFLAGMAARAPRFRWDNHRDRYVCSGLD